MKIKWTFLSVLTGLLAGVTTSLFLFSLEFVTRFHQKNSWLIWLLPVAGIITGILYKKYGREAERGTGLILEEIHDPKKILPIAMAPLVFIGTLLSHLTGASAGREGTAVQIGSTLADHLNKYFQIEKEERKILIVAGAGAAFSAAIGTPLAGLFFGLEVIQIGRLRFFALFECLIASVVSFSVVKFFSITHLTLPKIQEIPFNAHILTVLITSGIIFGLSANLFIQLTHLFRTFFTKYVRIQFIFPLVGGFFLLFLFSFKNTFQFRGLGLASIQNSFHEQTSWSPPFLKAIFSAITIASGFKGGEFIPLVFIGSTLGSFLSGVFSVSRVLLSALGFSAVFAAASNTPIACSLMAAELFGWKIFPYAILTCWVAYYFSGHIGIYQNQKMIHSKKDQLLKVFSWPQNMIKKILK